MATLKPENVIKQLDSLGRITLPKGLRDRMYLDKEHNKLEIFTFEANGKIYAVLATPDNDTVERETITV